MDDSDAPQRAWPASCSLSCPVLGYVKRKALPPLIFGISGPTSPFESAAYSPSWNPGPRITWPYAPFGICGQTPPPFGISGFAGLDPPGGGVQPLYSPCVYQTSTAHQSTPTVPRARLSAARSL